MNTFFGYILLGLSLSAPVGPINAEQLNKGIHNGFWHSWTVGLGAMTGDILFMLLIYLGMAEFLTTPFIKAFLWSFGFFVLVYTGVESIVASKKSSQHRTAVQEPITKTFLTGFFMAVSNPLNILFWLGIYGSVLAKTSTLYSNTQLLVYSSGIFIGILLWDFFMAVVAVSFRTFMNSRVLQFVSIGAGVCLIGFGLYFGYEAYGILFT